jgi:hypothetical protein
MSSKPISVCCSHRNFSISSSCSHSSPFLPTGQNEELRSEPGISAIWTQW